MKKLAMIPCAAAPTPAPFPRRTRDPEAGEGRPCRVIGNTLADRMQHSGWLETLLQSRYPQQELVLRNLGFSADELTLRLRSQELRQPRGVADPDENGRGLRVLRLQRVVRRRSRASEVQGLSREVHQVDHRREVQRQIECASGPVLPPIAHENLHTTLLPDGADNNKRLELYTKAMGDVAKSAGVPFVDLFHATQKL